MNRVPRILALSVLTAAAVLAACSKKKPETAVVPVQNNAPPPETCDRRCQDSIANSQRLAREAADAEARRRAAADAAGKVAAARAALIDKIYFDYDQSDISGDSRSKLDAKLPVLRANPAVRLRISGHADERGSDVYNLALGQRRAAAAKRYLTDQGIDPSRIDIVSYGEERPASTGTDETAFRLNRRDEFEIVAGAENLVPVANR
jgi:peptidoglycan-associated lipoprotein